MVLSSAPGRETHFGSRGSSGNLAIQDANIFLKEIIGL